MVSETVTDNPHILVAEGKGDWLEPVARAMMPLSAEFRVAVTDGQALNIIRNEHVDVALIATDMPGLSGLDLVRRIHEISRDLPVIVIGSRRDRHWFEEALRFRARAILPRPISTATVLEVIGRTLKVKIEVTRSRPTRQNRAG